MKLAVIGSRGFSDYELLCQELDKYQVDCIISGGAKGADQLAARYAQERKIDLVEHLPEYSKYGRRAPLVRNKLIADDSEILIAFWDGVSRGTAFTIDLARRQGKKVIVVNA